MVVNDCVLECSLWSEQEMAHLAMVQSQRRNHAFKDAVILILIAGRQKNALVSGVCATRETIVEIRLKTNQNAKCMVWGRD